ncbi:serine O-acetyltransferase [Mucilaginibacter gossypiicola]|uniref:Serine acetyltransferase n=1 Tax=Mucilaginibacter gossypiicola TaxID=551995 RepID=A0A1H8F2Y4_9SPHI|nr:serine O-acetyltransferase EpsC [Mucilaginibacter gossypiicola]SEN25724.1 serine O-acetyltransferase [Mucilaginibacter gossypiicola]
MSQDFYQHIFAKQQKLEAVPSNREITAWALKVIHLLYPEQTGQQYASVEELKDEFLRLENELCEIMHATKACSNCDTSKLAKKFFEGLPELFRVLNTDIQAIFNGDPAACSEFEVIRTYPGFYAISLYRLAHSLYVDDIPLLPRILTEYAHSKTGIDIHPAAQIDEYFYIDHGTGIVIGESCKIGKHVKLYQGVTLGALSVDKSMANTKRHPTVQDNVVIYSGATILGGETVIGHNSVVGGNVWLTKSLPPNSRVYHTPNHRVLKRLSIKLFGHKK